MAVLLSDKEIVKLLGSVIKEGDQSSIKPNSYILRLGGSGEFLNARKEFKLGKKKKGIIISPGHSVAVSAYEEIDFRREVVEKIFPGNDLYAMISPTTDLSREGIVAMSTNIDSGYYGTLNWTLTNSSSSDCKLQYGERIFRLTLWKLEKDERPENLYGGDYQGETGYVRSKRAGAPMGMKPDEWENSLTDGGPEEMLENLIKSGYPWNILGQRLKAIDSQFSLISNEYDAIADGISKMDKRVNELYDKYNNFEPTISKTIRETLNSEMGTIQNKFISGAGAFIIVFSGLVLSVTGNSSANEFLRSNSYWIGPAVVILGVMIYFLLQRKKRDH